MGNVRNRRIVVDGATYRWSTTGGDYGIGVRVGLEDPKHKSRGGEAVCVVPHDTLVLPSIVRRLVLAAHAAGWDPQSKEAFFIRLGGPFADEPLARPAPSPPESRDPMETALLASIVAAPGDDAPRLVYADWLLERGDPRGEYIALACSSSAEHATRAEALLAKHEATWLGPVVRLTRARRWTRGFLTAATLARRARGVIPPAIGVAAWRTVEELDADAGFLVPADIAAIVGGGTFDALEKLTIGADALVLVTRGHVPPCPVSLEVLLPPAEPAELAAALLVMTASPRLQQLRIGYDVPLDLLLPLARPGLALTVACGTLRAEAWAHALDAVGATFDEVRLADTQRRNFFRPEVRLERDEDCRWTIAPP